MTDSKHTPGPWTAAFGNVGGPSIMVSDENSNRFIASVREKFIRIGACGPEAEDRSPEANANAYLIAAAPELLELVRLYEITLRNRDQTETEARILVAVKLAIAKAEGRQKEITS
jgi:hypothetical protein